MEMNGCDIIPYHSMQGEMTFKDVSFTYPTRPNQTVLNDFNLTIPAGRMVAICGLSGGGKYSFLNFSHFLLPEITYLKFKPLIEFSTIVITVNLASNYP